MMECESLKLDREPQENDTNGAKVLYTSNHVTSITALSRDRVELSHSRPQSVRATCAGVAYEEQVTLETDDLIG